MSSIRALEEEATRLHQGGRLEDAARAYETLLAAAPNAHASRHMFGALRLQQNQPAQALPLLDGALAGGETAELLAHRALALQMLGRDAEALAGYDRALTLKPDMASAINNRANVLRTLGDLMGALGGYSAAARAAPAFADAWYNQGVVLLELARVEDAITVLARALALRPDHAPTLYNQGLAFARQGRHGEALRAQECALTLMPELAPAWRAHGKALLALRRFEAAQASFERALALDPNDAESWNERGAALQDQQRFSDALASFDRALAIQPRLASATANRALALNHMGLCEAALAEFDAALALLPDNAGNWYNRGSCLLRLRRFADAVASFEKALALDPAHPYALGAAANAVLNLCDWDASAHYARAIAEAVEAGSAIIPPFSFLNHCGDARLQLRCAQAYVADRMGKAPPPLWKGERYTHDRIRIAYLSADFHAHATAILMAGLFERHDRDRFEVTALSFGPDDGSPMRARLIRAFDHFHDVRGQGDAAVARLLREKQIDIAVDLKGHTQDTRLGILAHRPCPVQATYLGFPATTGAPFLDYVIADATVAPFRDGDLFSEAIVHMPHSYQVNDASRVIAAPAGGRREQGLPEQGFVFCCFNNNWKISPALFDVWMRLLAAAPGSVLWLLRDNDTAMENLRRQAGARGIDPDRLIFGERIAPADHLGRHVYADLFLDTLPNNAHTTASDALWAGLPVLTVRGTSFSGRVAASLLGAVGLEELIADDLAAYEEMALALTRDPARLAALRGRLGVANVAHPLFDTKRFARDIERAFIRMIERARTGLGPDAFAV